MTARVRQVATAPALELDGIARRFAHRWALRGVSLRVEPGESTGLSGPNGSGKTTLLRIAATALRPTRGSGRVFGHDLVADAAAVRAQVGYFGFSPGLYEDLTAAENLRFALRMAGLPATAAVVAAALAEVGLTREAGERVRTFSSGMRRRLALARLLLRTPRLLLLDEPYASLDPEGIERVNEFVLRTRKQGGAVVIATHDLDRAATVVDRVIRLDEGRVAAVLDGGALPVARAGVAGDGAAAATAVARRTVP